MNLQMSIRQLPLYCDYGADEMRNSYISSQNPSNPPFHRLTIYILCRFCPYAIIAVFEVDALKKQPSTDEILHTWYLLTNATHTRDATDTTCKSTGFKVSLIWSVPAKLLVSAASSRRGKNPVPSSTPGVSQCIIRHTQDQ